MDAGEKKALDDIKEYGCHVIHVLEEGELPPFAYSVGIQKTSGAAEVIVIGLKQELAHFMVNDYNRRVKAGEVFRARGLYSGFLEGFDVTLVPVDRSHYAEYLGWNRWLYGKDRFETLQIVYPTTAGVWPWDETAPDSFKARQPLLTDNGGRRTRRP